MPFTYVSKNDILRYYGTLGVEDIWELNPNIYNYMDLYPVGSPEPEHYKIDGNYKLKFTGNSFFPFYIFYLFLICFKFYIFF
jgi:hypothetical protein